MPDIQSQLPVQLYDGTNTVAIIGTALSVTGSVTAVPSSTSTYAEDSVHTTGHVGSFMLAVRNDSAATTFASADGDYSPISVDNVGRVIVTGTVASTIAQSVTIVPSGTQTVTGTVTTTYSGTQTVALTGGAIAIASEYAEDSVHTTGHIGSFMLAVRNDSATTTFASATGDYSPISVDNVGRVFVTGTTTSVIGQSVTIVPSGTQAVSIAQSVTIVPSGTQTVTGTVTSVIGQTVTTTYSGTQTVAISGTLSNADGYAEDSIHTTGHVGSFVLAVRNDSAATTFASASGDYSPISVDNVGRVFVTGTVTNVPSGTQAVSIAQSVTIVPSGTQTVTGTVTSVIGQTVTTTYSGTQTVAISGTLSNADGYAEDSVHTTGHVGSFVLAVRNDSAATTFASATGDYSPISVDNVGRVFVTGTVTNVPSGTQAVSIAQSVTIVPSGTQTVTGTVTSSISQTVTTVYSGTQTIALSSSSPGLYAEDSVHTTAHVGTFALGIRNDNLGTTLVNANGDYSGIALTATGQIYAIAEHGDQADGIVNSYGTVTTVASASTGTVAYTVSSGRTLFLKGIIASASGPMKITVDYGAGPTILATAFTSAASLVASIPFHQPPAITTGTVVRVKMTNNAGSAQDVYTTLQGHERLD